MLILWKDSVNHIWSPLDPLVAHEADLLHIATKDVLVRVESMREAEQLDELIASVHERITMLTNVQAQAKEVLESTEGRLKSTQELLSALERVREQIENKSVSVPPILPTLDRLRELLAKDRPVHQEPVVKQPLSPAEVVSKSKEVLANARRPMKRGQLVKALEAQGASLAGTDKNKNLGTILWRHPNDFVSLGMGYWIRGIPLEGIYDPEEFDKKEADVEYNKYRKIRFEIQQIQADHTSQSAAKRAALGIAQRDIESRHPSFPERWQADGYR